MLYRSTLASTMARCMSLVFLALLVSPSAANVCNFTALYPTSPSLHNCISQMPTHIFAMLSGSALVPNQIGEYVQCEYGGKAGENNTKMCVIDSSAVGFPLVQGMCVPEVCSKDDVRQFWVLAHCFNATFQPLMKEFVQPTWNKACHAVNASSACYAAFYLLENLLQRVISNATRKSAMVHAFDVHCGDNKVDEWTGGAIAMLLLCIFISLLVVANIVLETMEGTYQEPDNDGEHAPLLAANVRSLGSLQDAPEGLRGPIGRDSLNGSPNPPAHGVLQKEMNQRSRARRLLALFSIRDNYDLLMKREAARSLGCLDGIRAISMFWIILGHTGDFQGPGFVGFDNLNTYFEMFQRFTFQVAPSAQFCVDSFFFLSGLLTYYVLARKFAKGGRAPPFIMAVILRYFRLVPLVGFVIGFYCTLCPRFGFGPLWYKFTEESDRCNTWAWSNLVFANNFAPAKYGDQCMPWTWYLANDMQFFVYALFLFCFVYCRKPVLGAVAMALSTVASILYTWIYAYDNSLNVSSPAGQDTLYDKPWPRFAPFGVGCLTALLFSDVLKKTKPFQHRLSLAYGLMLLSIGGLLTIVYVSYDFFNNHWSRSANAAYMGITRTAFALCLTILTTLCTYGAGGFVNWFLTRPYWEPLGKLTFGAYLVHPIVIRVAYFSLAHTVHYTDIEYAVYFVAFLTLSYSIAFVLYLTIELPAAGLVGMLVPKK